jgi:hypothetical protein
MGSAFNQLLFDLDSKANSNWEKQLHKSDYILRPHNIGNVNFS